MRFHLPLETVSYDAPPNVVGRCHPRFDNPATTGDDAATRSGLVDAAAAVESEAAAQRRSVKREIVVAPSSCPSRLVEILGVQEWRS